MYGIKEPEPISDQEIMTTAKKMDVATYDIYKLSNDYQLYLDSSYGDSSDMKHRLIQPIQYLLFNSEGNLLVHSINCNAPGFPNLNWNTGGAFEVFPPKSLAEVDSSFSIEQLMPYFKPIEISHRRDGDAQYICVVFWNRFMGRQSRRLFEYIFTSGKEQDIRYYLVNNDGYFSSLDSK